MHFWKLILERLTHLRNEIFFTNYEQNLQRNTTPNYRKLFLNLFDLLISISLELNISYQSCHCAFLWYYHHQKYFYSFIDSLTTLESAGHVYTFKQKKAVYEYTYMCTEKKHMKIHRQCNTDSRMAYIFCKKNLLYTSRTALVYRLSAVWLYTKFTHIKNIFTYEQKKYDILIL